MKTDTNRAKAKALLLRDLMRIAAAEGCSPTAQALLATIIAEAWPHGKSWWTKLGYPVLEQRLSTTRNTIRRATHELELARLIRCHPGHGQRITRWQLPTPKTEGASTPPGSPMHPQRGHPRTREGSPMHPQGVTHAPSEGAPTPPDTGMHEVLQEIEA